MDKPQTWEEVEEMFRLGQRVLAEHKLKKAIEEAGGIDNYRKMKEQKKQQENQLQNQSKNTEQQPMGIDYHWQTEEVIEEIGEMFKEIFQKKETKNKE